MLGKVGFHNKFDVVVKDAETGKIKQRAIAYNVLLNTLLTTWASGKAIPESSRWGAGQLIYSIGYGSGTGTPAVTDTSLFTAIGNVVCGTPTTVYDTPTSYQAASITLGVGDANGKTITEVGVYGGSYSYYDSSHKIANCLISHAMLQDSEGNTISIVKDDTEIVIITATIYVTLTNSGFGTDALYPDPSANSLLKDIFFLNPQYTIKMSGLPCQTAADVDLQSSFYVSPSAPIYTTVVGTGVFSWPQVVIAPTDVDKKSVKFLGCPSIGVIKFPNHDIFPPYSVDLTLGTGDGVTTDFNVQCPHIMSGSEIVKIDELTKTKDVDYSIDYDSNPMDQFEEYPTAILKTGISITFGDYVYSTNTYGASDPCCLPDRRLADLGHYYITVSPLKPILINFGSAKSCNKLHIGIIPSYMIALTTTQIAALTVEYSTDGSTWTTVPNLTVSGQVWSFDLTNAQYWRVYLKGMSWQYGVGFEVAVQGYNTGATFFLGKSVPGLHFNTPPASGSIVTITYNIDIPYKTANNKITFNSGWQIGRG